MSIAVNLVWLDPGRVGGSEEYLTRQLIGFADVAAADPAAPDALELYVAPGFPAAHPDLVGRFPTHVAPVTRGGRAARIVAEHTWLHRCTRDSDLVHHGGGTVPLFGRRPAVLTVHDLQYLSLPHYFSPGRRGYLASMMPRSVRGAAVVAVPTEFVRREVIGAFGVDEERVVVVPHGVPPTPRPSDEHIAAVRRRYGLSDRPFLVYPAITHPHKGHRVLVDAIERCADELMLVLVGGVGVAEPALAERIAGSSARDRIVRTGRVPHADRDALLAGADALVFPSEFEGFGAPLVEAMALDTPVVAGDAGAVREVVGDAGVIVSGTDPTAWSAAIEAARGRRDELVAAGRSRRAAFTLDVSGRALADAYRRALS